MTNINIYIRENIAAIGTRTSIAPNIEEKKLNNAIKAFGYSGSPNNIIAIFDNTLFGSGKDGLIFTGERFIYRPSFSEPIDISYKSIVKVEYIEVWTGAKKDKPEHYVEVTKQDGSSIKIKGLIDCNYEKIADVLQTAINDFNDYKEERQLIPIDEMEESVKVSYVKAVINMAYDNDGVIDNREFAEILLLMTRLNLSIKSRFDLRAYVATASANRIIPLEQLLKQIDDKCPDGQIKSLHVSLTKDLISLFFCTGVSVASLPSCSFLQKNRSLLKVTDEDIKLIVMAIENDHNMLKDDVTDDQIVSALKTISAKAAAVGTPLAAVYLSGSVVGMSAAGITSGLATLGMGGMLGLSSMATGIGVAVLIGVGAYAGIRRLTGADELTRSKRRELMLNEVIKQTQLTISLLIEDINFITVRLNEFVQKFGTQDAAIKKLEAMMKMMKMMTGAGTVLTGKADTAQISAAKQRCAQFLDEAKLKSLTKEPTKADFFKIIKNFYEEKIFIQEKDGQKNEITKMVIKQGYTNKELEHLAKVFEIIGYFNASDVLKGTATDVARKSKDKLTELFS